MKQKNIRVPYGLSVHGNEEIKAVTKVLKSSTQMGKNVSTFEKKISKLFSKKYGLMVNSGSSALLLAMETLDIPEGSEVITPALTFSTTVGYIVRNKLVPVFVDVEEGTYCINESKIKGMITKKTKAIIATHIYNFPLRVDILKKICKKNRIILIEDAAEVIGQKLNNKLCGSYGDISIFSFYANKQITTGEGGMITTNNKKLYEQSKSLRNLCFGKQDRFNHEDIGWNYRMTNLQASLGVSQLKRIKSIVGKRHKVGNEYFQKLKDNKNIYIPETSRSYAKNIYWIIGFVITNKKLKIDAKKLMKILMKYGIQTRPFFWPMHMQRVFRNKYKINISGSYKNSEYISKYGLYLPSSLDIKSNQIKFICDKVNSILK